MKRSALLLLAVAAAFAAGVVYMLNVEYSSGGVYPEYSTLRTDQRGARLLYDSLAALPGVTVSRNYAPLQNLEDLRGSILTLGLPATFGDSDDQKLFERIAKHGNRVIAAFGVLDKRQEIPPSLAKDWGVGLSTKPDLTHTRTGGQYFFRSDGWQTVDREDDRTVAIERSFGDGVIVLLASSEDFTNESSVGMERLAQISTLLGEPTHIVFDEAHLGIAESGSVVGLARRFRLSGMAFGLAICAALFIWRNASAFPPPAPSAAMGSYSGRTSRAGLLTLLHRHVPQSAIVSTCWQQWLSTNRRSVPQPRLDRAAALAAVAGADPLQAIGEIQSVLRDSGPARPRA
jgi:hypothetical protein